nr:hypothetical protein [uncultured Mediterranean phage uvMED]BAR28541.1 hypothetical protein [uncultured Mediterranean phage uvMED]
MKTIKVNAYNYQELNEDNKNNVKMWLDELPFDYEDEDKQGNIIKKLDYPSDWDELDIEEHCQSNKYLFDKYGKCIHHLEIKGIK